MLISNPVIAVGSAAVAAAAIIALWSAATLVSTLFYQPTLKLSESQNTQATNAIDAATISNRNFFGLADEEPEIVLDQLPVTKLELILRGVFAAFNQDSASAIIENNNKESEHYEIGDEVAGNATLKSVHNDRVVLTRNGIFETLYFPDNDSANSGASAGAGALLNNGSQANSEARREAIRERIKNLQNRKKQ